jgi:thymidylate synthase (FAD)
VLKVKLLSYTPEPDRLVAAAANLCYSPVGIEDILERISPAKVERLLKGLKESGHESPIEHCSFSFGIEGVSRALTHQLVRHRIASFSQQSQRYVKLGCFEAIKPPSIEKTPETAAVFDTVMAQITEAYQKLLEAGVPAEDARFVLPNACESKIIATFNARSLMHFLAIRTCTRAQWEIRQLALEMQQLVREVAPLLFTLSGPSCATLGYCSEGKMGCGIAPTLEKLREIKD